MEYSIVLFTALLFGIGAFFTTTWAVVHITLHNLEALEDGGPLLKTAAIGAGLGAISALISPAVNGFGQGLMTVAVSALFTVHGRVFYLATKQLATNPRAWFVEKAVVSSLSALMDAKYQDLYKDPAALRAYLDRTYGKGVVKPDDLTRGLLNASSRQVEILKRNGASTEEAILEATANAIRAQKSLEDRVH